MRFLVLFLITSCASAPRCELPTHTTGAPFLWKVQKPNGAVVWLYGTIHVAGIAAVPASAITALDGAKRFASELGDLEPDPDKLGELTRLPFGQVLDAQLPSDDWYDLVDALRGTIKAEDLRHARPWFAMTRLTSRLAPSPKPSMDDALTEHAKDHHLPIDHLETWDAQMQALVDGVNIADLQQTIHLRNTLACEVDKLRALYANGDAVSLEPLLVARDQATLIDARNAKWQVQLEQYDGVFVAVGLGHLLGDHGLIATFTRAGYTVQRAPAAR